MVNPLHNIEVKIHANAPIFVEADAKQFGWLFANMNDDEQAAVLASMIEHMKPHRIQWGFIRMRMENDHYDALVDWQDFLAVAND